jgi:hypothetical protein
MDAGTLTLLLLLAIIAAAILLPVYLRNLLYRKALDTVAKALERGIDPERIAIQLPQLRSEAESDPNGNWKAGVVLNWLALGVFITITIPALLFSPGDDGAQAKWLALILPIMLCLVAAALLQIHRRIVGKVVRFGQRSGTTGVTLGPDLPPLAGPSVNAGTSDGAAVN